jgi:hypothetical protein
MPSKWDVCKEGKADNKKRQCRDQVSLGSIRIDEENYFRNRQLLEQARYFLLSPCFQLYYDIYFFRLTES